MRAVVMAGGEGTRLRPLTTNVPKPLLPVVGEPIMGHVLRLLSRHGFAEAVVTVQYLAGSLRSYFGDGSDYGLRLTYVTETVPLGTAGSVRNAAAGLLANEPFVVVSGDSLTDIDLTELVAFHHRMDAMVTVALVRKPNVVEFGNVILGEAGRIERFIEKPTWGQVFSDTVNTGIYVMRPEVLDLVEPDEFVDWSADVFPKLLGDGARMFGYVSDAYWEDIGTFDSYVSVQRDVLRGAVDVAISGFEVAAGVYLGEGAVLDPAATVLAPSLVGANCVVERECVIGPGTVLGSNTVVRRGSRVVGSVLDSGVYVDSGCEIHSALVGRSCELRPRVHVDQGAVVGDHCLLEEEVRVAPGVLVNPSLTVEAGATVTDNVVWEGQGHRVLFGPRGVSGMINLDITPEMVVRLGAAFATLLPKGSTVTVGRDHSRAARAMNRALAGSFTAAGLNVHDLRISPLPIVRSDTAGTAEGGVYLRTTLAQPDSLDLLILDRDGSDLSPHDQKRLERVLVRRDFRRAFAGDIGDIHTPHRSVDDYADRLSSVVDISGVPAAQLKVVVDTGLGTASLVLPQLLTDLGITLLTVNNRLDEEHPTSTQSDYHAGMARLGELVSSSRSDLGVRFDPTGERLSLVDETGRPFDHGRALLVLLDLVAAERRSGVVAVPAQITRIAEQVTAYHNVAVERTGTSTQSLSAAMTRPGLIFAGDGRGGFIVPEMGPNADAIAAFLRLIGLVARTQLTLSAIDRRIPKAHMARAAVPTPWSRRGAVMRALVETAGSRMASTVDGVRIQLPDGDWVLAVPDQVEAVIRLWAESSTTSRAEALLAQWFSVIESQVV